MFRVLSMVVLCLHGMPCSASVPPPCVRVQLEELQWDYGDLSGTDSPEAPLVKWVWKLQCNAPWSIACVLETGHAVEMRDSRGSKLSQAPVSFNASNGFEPFSAFESRLFVEGKGWKPSLGAAWIDVRGTVAVAVFRSSRESELVAVKMEEGGKSSVVLKGAGMDPEEDVTAVLSVSDVIRSGWKNGPGQGILAEIRVESMKPCGVRAVKFYTKEGKPMEMGNASTSAITKEKGKSVWSRDVWLETDMGEELKVVVYYASGLQKVDIPLSCRVGLGGVVRDGGEKDRGEKGS